MFSYSAGESVNIHSIWKGKREFSETGVQTDVVAIAHQDSQHPNRNSVQVKTEDNAEWSSEHAPEYNIFVLLAFLQKVEKDVFAQLEHNLSSRAFQYYRLIDDTENEETQKLNELHNPEWSQQFQCTAIAWCPTVPILALGYGSGSHENWCDHESGVALWNLDREILLGKVPQNTIEMDGCVTAMAFHPLMPSCLSVGKVTGEVCVINTAPDEDANIVSSKESPDGHKEPVTALIWVPDPTNGKRLLLMSSSLDGRILLWNISENTITVVDGFILLSQHLPHSLSVKHTNAEVGVTCMSVNNEDPSLFLVGTEGGALFQCSLHSQVPTHYRLSNGTPLKDPVGMTFALHSGYIQSVQFSPHTRNIFLSCDSSGVFRISTLLQPQPVVTMQLVSGLSCACWSPTCPTCLAIVTMDGDLHLFDLSLKLTGPFATIPLGEGNEKSPGTALRFNANKAHLVATASANGHAQVWRLSSRMTSVNVGELETLLRLGTPQQNTL